MILVNGKETDTVQALDRGFQYGDGLFETMAVVNGHPRLWAAHMERLEEGCARLALPQPDPELLAGEAARALRGRERAVLKLVISRGSGGRGYRSPEDPTPTRVMSVSPWPTYPDCYYDTGVEIRLCRTRLGCNPALAGIKHLNRLEQVLARSEWRNTEIAEGLMLDSEGSVAEATMSNIFIRTGDRLQTPPVDRCGVAGVMRKWVLGHGKALNLDIKVAPLSLDAMRAAEECFLTNAVIGIWPVRRFEDTEFPQVVTAHRLNRMLAEEFDA